MWKSTNEDRLRRVELVSKEKAEREEEHVHEMEEVISDAKISVVVAVWEAKIHLAEGLENVGSSNVDSWREALAKLSGKPATANQDPVLRLSKEEEKKADDD